MAVRPDSDLQVVTHCVPYTLKDLGNMPDHLQRIISRLGKDWREGIELACRVSLFNQLDGDFPGLFRVLPDAFGRHIRVGAQLLMEAPTQQIVDGLTERFADDVPAGHFDRAQRRRHVQTGIAIVVTRSKHCLPQLLDVEGVGADNKLLAQIFDQPDLRVQVFRIPRWPFTQSDDTLIRFQQHKQPQAPAAKGWDIPDHDGLYFYDFHFLTPIDAILNLIRQ